MGWMGEWDRIWTNSGSQRRLNKLTSDLTQNRIVNREPPWDMMWYVRYINTLSFIHCVSSRIYIWYHVVNLIYSFSYQFFIIFIKFSVIKCFYFRFSFTILNKSKTCSLVAINSLCGSHWISIFFHFIQVNIWKKNWVNCFRDFPRLKCLKNPTFRPVLPVFFRLFKMLPIWRIAFSRSAWWAHMTYRDHYTTYKWCQTAREMQSEACLVLKLFCDNSPSPTFFFAIKDGVKDWFPCFNVAKTTFRNVSVVMTQFLRGLCFVFNKSSLSCYDLCVCPVNLTPLCNSMVCRARPPSSLPIRFSAGRVFPLRMSSFVSLTLSLCSFFLVWIYESSHIWTAEKEIKTHWSSQLCTQLKQLWN